MTNRGFTLIELMIVIVIVGLLAAIVMPQWDHARERTYVAVMKTDLRNFLSAQESHFYDFATYSADPATVYARGFETSQGVSLVVNEATATGWSATVTHTSTPSVCSIYMGSAAPLGAATHEGTPSCT